MKGFLFEKHIDPKKQKGPAPTEGAATVGDV